MILSPAPSLCPRRSLSQRPAKQSPLGKEKEKSAFFSGWEITSQPVLSGHAPYFCRAHRHTTSCLVLCSNIAFFFFSCGFSQPHLLENPCFLKPGLSFHPRKKRTEGEREAQHAAAWPCRRWRGKSGAQIPAGQGEELRDTWQHRENPALSWEKSFQPSVLARSEA